MGEAVEQFQELEEIMKNPDYGYVVYAYRVTPPDRDQETNVYRKGALKVDVFLEDLPAERVVHHRNGDVTFVLSGKGVFRFVNVGDFRRKVYEVMCVVHDL